MIPENELPNGARARLDKISHHFLSGAPGPSRTKSTPHLLPVLLPDTKYDTLFLSLAHTMAAYRQPAAILQVGRSDIFSNASSLPALTHITLPMTRNKQDTDPALGMERLIDAIRDHVPSPRLCMIPVNSVAAPVLTLFPRIVILTSIGKKDIVETYLQIKPLASWKKPPAIGIVTAEADDTHQSQYAFEELAEAALRFLHLPITWCGNLAERNPTHASASTHDMHTLAQVLSSQWSQPLAPIGHDRKTP